MLKAARIVVTGACGTLGQAVAKKAHDYGATVIGLDIVSDYSSDYLSEYHAVDLTDRQATKDCFAALGDFTALANVAGGFQMGARVADENDDQWQQMFLINVETLRNALIAAFPILKMQPRGSIVNIGAYGALTGQGDMSAYCCAKSSVMKLTESLAEEHKPDSINVNAVLPTIIDTPANRAAMPDADFADWVSPEKLAEVICFLVSEGASDVTGALIPVRARS